MIATVSDVLIRAATLLDKGVCRGANARLKGGKACGVFDQRATSYSMYGALCAVLGPGLGDEKALQVSPAWKLIALRAWDALPQDMHVGARLEFALHDFNDWVIRALPERNYFESVRGDWLRAWAAEPEITALGEWR